MKLLVAAGYSREMLVHSSKVPLTLLLRLRPWSLEEFFLLRRTYQSLIEIMVAIEEVIVLTTAFLRRFKPSPANA